MATTIQISNKLKNTLQDKKFSDRESYENVIWDLLEDSIELNKETKIEIAKAREEIKKGNYKTLSQIKKELGI